MGRGSPSSWGKIGCLIVSGLGLVALIALGIASGVAVRQNRSAEFQREALAQPLRRTADPSRSSAEPLRLRLTVHTAGLSVRPIAAGESVRIDADYDPRYHVFSQNTESDGEVTVMSVTLRPAGSTLMALLRVKVGGRPAKLRVALPRDVPLEIEGRLDRAFATMELGGLTLRSTKLKVRDGAVKVSFIEPLVAPMERLAISGNRGSLSVVGLGNASPRETWLLQHLGAVDLDLRGEWSRDAKVRLIGGAAGGSLWLPSDVTIRGLDENRGVLLEETPELSRPTLELSISETVGRFIVMD